MKILETVKEVLATLSKQRLIDAVVAQEAVVARRLVDKNDAVQVNPDDLPTTLSNLLASSGAGAAISTAITGTDLTTSGVLTTLATNIGANDTQAQGLVTALKAVTTFNATVGDANLLTTLTGLASAAAKIGAAVKKASLTVATTGFSINVNTASQDEIIALNPAGTLATGTVVFPSDANSRVGQKLTIITTQTQTALTLTTTGLTILGTAVTALTANTAVSFEKVAAATWIRTS